MTVFPMNAVVWCSGRIGEKFSILKFTLCTFCSSNDFGAAVDLNLVFCISAQIFGI